MKFKRHTPARRKLRSAHRHGWASEGIQQKMDAVTDEFVGEKNALIKGVSVESIQKVPSGKWRKKYQCRNTKGDHEFQLVKPDYSFMDKYRDLTVDEYYEQEKEKKAERDDFFSRVMYHYRCIHCQKKEYAWGEEKVPNRKIRKLIGVSANGRPQSSEL